MAEAAEPPPASLVVLGDAFGMAPADARIERDDDGVRLVPARRARLAAAIGFAVIWMALGWRISRVAAADDRRAAELVVVGSAVSGILAVVGAWWSHRRERDRGPLLRWTARDGAVELPRHDQWFARAERPTLIAISGLRRGGELGLLGELHLAERSTGEWRAWPLLRGDQLLDGLARDLGAATGLGVVTRHV